MQKGISKEINKILILPDIRSAENVGAMFRTADASGIDKVFLTGISACPVDKFGRVNSKIAKASLGAEKYLAWEYQKSLLILLRKLKKENYQIIALEQDENSIDYKKVKIKEKVVFIIGNEVNGLPKNILKECDTIAEIKMKGKKESLNVSVSLGIFLFRVLNI